MQCQNGEVYFLIPFLLINQRKHPHLFYFKDITGNKRLGLQYLSFCIQTINWGAQSCHCYLALTKSVLLMASSGNKSTERFAGSSPSFAVSAAAETPRHHRISPWTRAACPPTPSKDNLLLGLGQQQLAGNICTVALPQLIVLIYWLLFHLHTLKFILSFSFSTHNTHRRKMSQKSHTRITFQGIL